MTNLRTLAEQHLAQTLENSSHFGQPVILVDPDGVEYEAVYGQILYDTKKIDADVGIEVLVHDPVVTVRKSSLARVPFAAEKNQWAAKIPSSPIVSATIDTYLIGRVSEDGGSIGFIRLYLSKAVQS